MRIELWLYGPLSRYGGAADEGSHAQLYLELDTRTTMRGLLEKLGIPLEEKGITFINRKLSAMPGLATDLEQQLVDGDRVAIFHTKSMWPFQYRHGVAMTDQLRVVMDEHDGGLHHKYD